ncbi:MAG TPA: AbrB/MazE/SpoVT family DNA-binding domain-containing protein, partial [Dongiaceae bacterium]|nr:AbrB/MazE/SpoVT family DNA-binding domain-containing protein [Dongiaceae bacterium]
MQVAKWGNSLAVRLPASVVKALQLKEGDNVEIQVAGARSFGIAKAPSARELLARLPQVPRAAAGIVQVRPARSEGAALMAGQTTL